MHITLLIATLSLLPLNAYSATIYVPDDYSTIQEAIDTAIQGDQVIVRPGTYVENIDFLGKAIVVTSEKGPEVTTIDGGQPPNADFKSVVRFVNQENRDSVIEGFTIISGRGTRSPLVHNRAGGGIYCEQDTAPTIRGNIITGNQAHWGCGIYCGKGTSPLIDENLIVGNSGILLTYGNGGGIFCDDSSFAEITGNRIQDNFVKNGGGGISCWSEAPTLISGNVISGNFASNRAGGIDLICSNSLILAANLVVQNSTGGDGGGISASGPPSLSNNIIAGNTAQRMGGGIKSYSVSHDPIRLTNVTVAGNSTLGSGGGICGGDMVIENSVLWNNTAPSGAEMTVGANGTCSISYSNVQGGQSGIQIESGCILDWGSGMIDADPLFVDPASDDFHIPFDSPCRSAGSRNAPGLPDTDFEGDPRTGLFVFPDIGADEFHTRFYVNGTVSSGSTTKGVIIGWPRTNPVLLISGSGVLPTPDSTPFGDFWLMPPWNHRLHFNPMPDNGVRIIERVISTGLPPGTQISLQALVGTELSNLWIVEIE